MKKILEEMRRRTNRLGPADPVFPNDDGNHYSAQSIHWFVNRSPRRLPEMEWLPEMTIHGFRTTLTGWGKNYGRPNLVDIQLDHMPKGDVAQAQAPVVVLCAIRLCNVTFRHMV